MEFIDDGMSVSRILLFRNFENFPVISTIEIRNLLLENDGFKPEQPGNRNKYRGRRFILFLLLYDAFELEQPGHRYK